MCLGAGIKRNKPRKNKIGKFLNVIVLSVPDSARNYICCYTQVQ